MKKKEQLTNSRRQAIGLLGLGGMAMFFPFACSSSKDEKS